MHGEAVEALLAKHTPCEHVPPRPLTIQSASIVHWSSSTSSANEQAASASEHAYKPARPERLVARTPGTCATR